MAEKLDPQLQIRIIELAREWMLQMKPVLPKSRNIDGATNTRLVIFNEIYARLVKTIIAPRESIEPNSPLS
jgi:hypothetical protein